MITGAKPIPSPAGSAPPYDPLTAVARLTAPQNQTPQELRAPVWDEFVQLTNPTAAYRRVVNFGVNTLTLDNYTDQWIFFIDVGRYLIPWQVGVVWHMPGNDWLTFDYIIPANLNSLVQIATPKGFGVFVAAYAERLQPNPGYNVLSAIQTLYNIT